MGFCYGRLQTVVSPDTLVTTCGVITQKTVIHTLYFNLKFVMAWNPVCQYKVSTSANGTAQE